MINLEILGETKQVLAAMQALKNFLRGYTCPAKKQVIRDLKSKIEVFERICGEFGQLGEGLQTAFKNVYFSIGCLPVGVEDKKAARWLIKMVDQFLSQNIIDAETFIINHVRFDFFGFVVFLGGLEGPGG